MDRWLFGEKKFFGANLSPAKSVRIVLESNSSLRGKILKPNLRHCNVSPSFLGWYIKSGRKVMPPSPMNIPLPRRRRQRTPEKHRYISTRLQRVYIPENNNVHRHHAREHQSHSSSYNVDRHFLWYNVSHLHSGRAFALVQAGPLPASIRTHTMRAVTSNETSQNTARLSSVHCECTTAVWLRNQSITKLIKRTWKWVYSSIRF